MKKIMLLSVFCAVSCGLVAVFYIYSRNNLAKNHEATINILSKIQYAETSLEKDILRARSNLIRNYDTITDESARLTELCHDLGVFFAVDQELIEKQKMYCELIDKKIDAVERFKSKNAVLKNSLYYIHQASLDFGFIQLERRKAASYDLFNVRQIVRFSLAYAAVPTSKSKSALIEGIKKSKQGRSTAALPSELRAAVLHAEKIIEHKLSLDEIVQEIVAEKSAVSDLSLAYLNVYDLSASRANIFKNLLFALCVAFFLLIVIGIEKIWRSAEALSSANQNLEARVLERTADLKKSQEIIIEQQLSLVASSKLSALGAMAGGIAHEINTPLAIIAMRSELLEELVAEGTFTAKDVSDALRIIKMTNERIAKIVSGLRFFARDGRDAPSQDYPLVNIVEDTLSFCAERFKAHGVEIQFKDKQNFFDTFINCRAVEVSQVLLNLLNNAYDAVQGLPEMWIRIELKETADHIEISVVDSGKGIPPAIQDKLMQPFFTTKEVGKGTGLGLSISRGIMESHNGKLIIDNQCSNTKFTLVLPREIAKSELIAS